MFTNDLQPENLNTIAAFSTLNKQHEALHIENFFFINISGFFHYLLFIYLFYVCYRAAKVNTLIL